MGCQRWSDLSIAADGSIALCCMDSSANLGLGNAFERPVLELFKERVSRFVPDSLMRGDAPLPCKSCTYYQHPPDTKILAFSVGELKANYLE
jgi:hypothetical protein